MQLYAIMVNLDFPHHHTLMKDLKNVKIYTKPLQSMYQWFQSIDLCNLACVFAEYLDVVSKALDTTGPMCNKMVQTAHMTVGKMLQTDSGRKQLKKLFKFVFHFMSLCQCFADAAKVFEFCSSYLT